MNEKDCFGMLIIDMRYCCHHISAAPPYSSSEAATAPSLRDLYLNCYTNGSCSGFALRDSARPRRPISISHESGYEHCVFLFTILRFM